MIIDSLANIYSSQYHFSEDVLLNANLNVPSFFFKDAGYLDLFQTQLYRQASYLSNQDNAHYLRF